MMSDTNITDMEEQATNTSSLVNLDDFGQYLTYASFQEIVHHIKKISLERIVANEPVPEYHLQSQKQTLAKTA